MPSNQNRDNFIDKAFTVIAESIVKIMPIAEKEKKAYIYYRDGLAAQNNGDYSEALEYYKESLLLEENKIDRGETLKNMAIIYPLKNIQPFDLEKLATNHLQELLVLLKNMIQNFMCYISPL